MNKINGNVLSTVIARINNVDVLIVENDEKRVPVTPICNALGIDSEKEIEKVKSDKILMSRFTLEKVDSADSELFCIPLRYVFGWLFTVNPGNVAPEDDATVIEYRMKCYDALYNHILSYIDFTEFKNKVIEKQMILLDAYRAEFNIAKNNLIDAHEILNELRSLTFEQHSL